MTLTESEWSSRSRKKKMKEIKVENTAPDYIKSAASIEVVSIN